MKVVLSEFEQALVSMSTCIKICLPILTFTFILILIKLNSIYKSIKNNSNQKND